VWWINLIGFALFCNNVQETSSHIFLECSFARIFSVVAMVIRHTLVVTFSMLQPNDSPRTTHAAAVGGTQVAILATHFAFSLGIYSLQIEGDAMINIIVAVDQQLDLFKDWTLASIIYAIFIFTCSLFVTGWLIKCLEYKLACINIL
jgi:hypothetical protein